MTPIVDYLTSFEHVARIQIQDLAAEAENLSRSCLTSESHHTDQYRRLVKDYVRFRWINHLTTVKSGPLTVHEFSIGLSSFEALYPS